MFQFIAADLKRHWIGVAVIVLIVALATALGVAVTLQERALRLGSARAAEAFDLVVGAPGSDTQLVLSSVFLQAAPLPLMPGAVFADLSQDPRVAWAAPIGFGDFVDGDPIVGTTEALLKGLGGVTEGRGFASLGEAVVGALDARQIGDSFHPMHGTVGSQGEVHTGITYRVVGRMAPTGTPWDRAVLVPIQAVWMAHHHHHDDDEHENEADASAGADTGAPALNAAAADQPAERGFGEGSAPHAQDDDDHDDAPADLRAPIDEAAVTDPHAPGLPAILVKPQSFADAYKLRQAYRGDRTLAVFPGEVLTRLYGTLGDVRRILSWVAAGAQGLVAAAILLVVMVHVMQRRRQIGALRAFGAPRRAVFGIVWVEAFAIIGLGVVVGFGLGYAGARVASGVFTASSGISLPVTFLASDASSLVVLFVLTGLIAVIPAALAYRQSPASALRGG
ncbi:ABC transporter permease [Mangrovibrevibacter kandeliae]|uniref:ABC transporter permease n=1 Tax=Mangrovibrevibacter kandeliae TaxID=2968473 RepID=UPI002117BE15|nr:ABC transporter permease [Aurantimonas sp. CSK15Z-1]MCQ8783432.1 ABC transporter permease [Aurantimonas sp. CSK15Z-1]